MSNGGASCASRTPPTSRLAVKNEHFYNIRDLGTHQELCGAEYVLVRGWALNQREKVLLDDGVKPANSMTTK